MSVESELIVAQHGLKQLLLLSPLTKQTISKDLKAAPRQLVLEQSPALPGRNLIMWSDLTLIRDTLADLSIEAWYAEFVQQWVKIYHEPSGPIVARELVMYLINKLPKQLEITTGGVRKELATPTSDMARFFWSCQIVDQPLLIMEWFHDRKLAARDISCVAEVFPEYYHWLVQELVTNTVNEYTVTKPMPRRVRTMLAITLQAPTISLEQLSAYNKHGPEKPPTPPMSGTTPNLSHLEGTKK